MARVLVVLVSVLILNGCLFKKAPRIRLATATEAEINEARQLRKVWYEFKKGDVVPFTTTFYGAGLSQGPSVAPVQAQQDFWLVFKKNAPVSLSLNGRSIMQPGSTILLVTPAGEGKGGQVNWLQYVGRPTEAEDALQKLLATPQAPAE